MERVAETIAGRTSAVPGAIEQALSVAAGFIDLIFVPNQMCALLGDDPDTLLNQSARSIEDAFDLLKKGGWLTRGRSARLGLRRTTR